MLGKLPQKCKRYFNAYCRFNGGPPGAIFSAQLLVIINAWPASTEDDGSGVTVTVSTPAVEPNKLLETLLRAKTDGGLVHGKKGSGPIEVGDTGFQ